MGKSKLTEYAIGLDVGTNSVGWSVIKEKDGKPLEFVDCGSRIFIRSVEDKSPTPKNRKRRESRLQRRQVQRRSRRKSRLRNYLILKGFLPDVLRNNPAPEEELNKLGDPYLIRKKALDEELTSHEFGRAILHLGTRRGFLSNRKTSFGDLGDDAEALKILEKEDGDSQAKDKEEGKLKEEIRKLREKIHGHGARTLGEYLAGLERKRNRGSLHDRHTDRRMYREEFSEIWKKQSQCNPDLYKEEIREELEKIIFSQRPLKLKPDRVGHCSFERNLPRTRQARLEFQRFRYWCDINNLWYRDPETGETEIRLSQEQKEIVADALEKTERITWAGIIKLLGLKKKTSFNLQKVEGKKKSLRGNGTACGIREILKDKWDLLDEMQQYMLVEDLISYTSKKGLKRRLCSHWKFSEEKATRLAILELEEDHANLSLKAIRSILPHLQEGKRYNPDAVEAAGYKVEQPQSGNLDTLPHPPWIPNPIVQKALYEIRRVVNAIIARYGKPSAIRIEMARDLEMNTKKYKQALDRQSKNTKANEKAEEQYDIIRDRNPSLELRRYISYQDKLKYRLWEESGGRCAYSGKSIGMTKLFTHATEVDHILPYKRTLDNSYMNKVVCLSEENKEKGDRTPWEAFGETAKWDAITMISEEFPDPKRKRILTNQLDGIDDFISNQLSDTRYISSETGKYIRSLGCDISFTKGGATSWLRHQWGLNSLLGESLEKNREDHRHHAIDATVIALTSRSLYQRIVRLASESDDDCVSPEHGMEVPQQIPELRNALSERLGSLIVSHSTNRKITGALHKETAYGIRKGADGKTGVVVRRMLADMTERDKENIVCPVVKKTVERYVWEQGGKIKNAMRKLVEKPLYHPKTGNEIRRARVWVETLNPNSYWKQSAPWDKDKILRILRYGNNHHVEIIRNRKNGKYDARFVTTMEAAKRVRISKKPIIQKIHGKDWQYMTYLCINDTVSIEEEGKRKFYRVTSLDPDANRVVLKPHNDATPSKNKKKQIRRSISVLMKNFKMQKESVDALGYLYASRK